MYFVYTLSYKDVIFYIGCSKNVEVRYKEHLSCKRICPLYDYIRSIKNNGEFA